MKVRRLTRQYGFSGYSIYRYLVNENIHNGSYLLLWCEETAQAVASYWNASFVKMLQELSTAAYKSDFSTVSYTKNTASSSPLTYSGTIWIMSDPAVCSPDIPTFPRSSSFRPADVLSTLNIKLMPKTAKKGFTYFRFETVSFL